MADFECRFGPFKPERAGIIEIFTSGAMQSAVYGVAEPLASTLSAEARAHLHHGGFENEGEEPYGVDLVDHDQTAVAFVGPRTEQGYTNEKIYHSLNAHNH